MTVKLLMDWPDSRNGKNYLAGNLLTTDAGTESGLVSAKMATTTLAGGTAYVPPVVQRQRHPVESEFDPLTGGVKVSGGAGSGLEQRLSGLIALSGDSRASLGSFVTALAQGCAIGYHNGFAHHLQSITNGQLIAWPVTAVSGIDTGHLLSTQLPKLLRAKPQAVINILDVNDFYGSSRSSDYVISQKLQFWRALSESGIVCIEINSTPYGTGGANYTGARWAQHMAYVQWVNANFTSLFPGHILVDAFSIAANADGSLASGYCYDGIHPNYQYAKLIAQKIVDECAGRVSFLPAIRPRLLSTNDQFGGAGTYSKNVFSKSVLAGTLGDVKVATGWGETSKSNSNLVLATLQASPYGIGNRQLITVDFSAAGNYAIGATDSFTAGSRLRGAQIFVPSAIVDVVSDPTGIVSGMDIRATVSDGTNVKYSFGGGAYSVDTSGVFSSSPVTQMPIIGPAMSFSNKEQGGGSAITTDAINSIALQIRCFAKGAGRVAFAVCEPSLWQIEQAVYDTSGVTGAVTCNAKGGRVAAAAAATSIVINNSLVTDQSIVFAQIASLDATAAIKSVVAGAGTITINLTAPTATTVVNWEVRS